MAHNLTLSVVCVLLLVVVVPVSANLVTTYRAAVYERCDPSNASVPLQETMLQSVELYKEQAQRAAQLNVDILVFPEYGVTGLSVPGTREGLRPFLQVLPWLHPGPVVWNPCLEDETGFNSTIIRLLSCVAREYDITLVANFGTIVPCDNSSSSSSRRSSSNDTCPSDGAFQFNSDVVFASNGSVLAVYHKINLYNEPAFDFPPVPPAITTFDTAFGSFGLVTCFDILWRDPTVLLALAGIRNVLMPTAWVDGLPFLTSVQSQMAWAIGLDINLMAANIQRPADGYRGSGIYSGRSGYLAYVYGPLRTGTLLIADLPSIPAAVATAATSPATTPAANECVELDQFDALVPDAAFNYSGIIYDDLSNYTLISLNASHVLSGTVQTESGNVHCILRYAFDDPVDEGQYFLAAYQGDVSLGGGVYVLSVEVCALMWCQNADSASCSRPPVTSTSNMTMFHMTGNFTTPYIYPSVLRHDLQLIPTTEWSFAESQLQSKPPNDGGDAEATGADPPQISTGVSAELKSGAAFSYRPIVASLYGRHYQKDTH